MCVCVCVCVCVRVCVCVYVCVERPIHILERLEYLQLTFFHLPCIALTACVICHNAIDRTLDVTTI